MEEIIIDGKPLEVVIDEQKKEIEEIKLKTDYGPHQVTFHQSIKQSISSCNAKLKELKNHHNNGVIDLIDFNLEVYLRQRKCLTIIRPTSKRER